MVKLINAVTGSEMWVHEDRLEEYLKRGHRLAPPPPAPPRASAKRTRTKKTDEDK